MRCFINVGLLKVEVKQGDHASSSEINIQVETLDLVKSGFYVM